MRRQLSLTVLLTGLLFGSLAANAAEANTNAESAVVLKKAQELTAGRESRVDKMLAIHAFVRDEIKQAKTQYG